MKLTDEQIESAFEMWINKKFGKKSWKGSYEWKKN